MNLNSGWTELSAAFKSLREAWQEVQAHWDDPVREHFEDSIWTPLENQVKATLQGIERASPVLGQIQKDCGDEPDDR